MNNEFTIGRISINDFDTILSMESKIFGDAAWLPNEIDECITTLNVVLCAKINRHIVGYLFGETPGYLNIMSVAVLPHFRRLGVASSLVWFAGNICPEEIKFAQAVVLAENVEANDFFRRIGFRASHHDREQDAFHFTRRISDGHRVEITIE